MPQHAFYIFTLSDWSQAFINNDLVLCLLFIDCLLMLLELNTGHLLRYIFQIEEQAPSYERGMTTHNFTLIGGLDRVEIHHCVCHNNTRTLIVMMVSFTKTKQKKIGRLM